jgi:isopenicillin-N N-acyltransferase-like protein
MALHHLQLHGTPTAMGRQHGEALREQAQAMCYTRLALAARAAEKLTPARDLAWCLDVAAQCVQPVADYAPDVFAEWSGIAEAAGLTMPEMVIGNGWTDFADLLHRAGGAEAHGCTFAAFTGERTADGLTYAAQTWDMSPSARPHLALVRRRPSAGPATLGMTTAGCLSLIAMNEAGIGIGNTNLVPTDARAGVHYLALIHQALAQTTPQAALAAIADAQRLSGHFYYLAGPGGEVLSIETTAERHECLSPVDGALVHTNHYLAPAFAGEAFPPPSASSAARQARMSALVAETTASVGPGEIQRLLSDHAGEWPICRHCDDPASWASLAAVIMCPQAGKLWVAAGNPCENITEEYTV